ncbi:MAG: amylo-alpha,6-glucosidase [Acidimicrobiales bacterium]|nr:amylo-alpha,6-glucosidase [Acidimicrobiales bacterium]
MEDPLQADADNVASAGRRQLVLVDGRTFAISDESGQMTAPTHGLVYDDRRHLSHLAVWFDDADIDILASSAPTPLSAVVVARVASRADRSGHAVLTRHRWVASGLREDVRLRNTSQSSQRWTLRIRVAADFAHIFDVKAGLSSREQEMLDAPEGWIIAEAPGSSCFTRIRVSLLPDAVDLVSGTVSWQLDLRPREDAAITLTVEPVVDQVPAGLAFPCGTVPADAIPMRRLESWRASVPGITSTDPRLSVALDQALADIAALRIIDAAHADRVVIAAGAPWFMTLFGRDSLLASWMTLPFEPSLAAGVLSTLADLQGTTNDPVAEEQPGKILHELRRHGGGGPFATRSRYYGTVDATPLFVMLAAEAHRWGALSSDDLLRLGPAVDAALSWILGSGDSDSDGFVDYRRSDPSGLSNQGWKDSWDGVNSVDGSVPHGPIALVEVQGYAYAALLGAVDLVEPMALDRDVADLVQRAERLKDQFNDRFWDPRGWFALALDGDGRRVDSLTTNPGHALWAGIASAELADRYLDRLIEPAMWTGWGLRTLADSMSAYDPLSYHNGSVWPHDTALCAAGAARYGRWDVVDIIVNGALDAANEFGGRPPELFAGISRGEVPMPVAYPSSCSPQAWSSASILLLIRTMLDLNPSPGDCELQVQRTDLTGVPDLELERIVYGGRHHNIRLEDGRARIVSSEQ